MIIAYSVNLFLIPAVKSCIISCSLCWTVLQTVANRILKSWLLISWKTLHFSILFVIFLPLEPFSASISTNWLVYGSLAALLPNNGMESGNLKPSIPKRWIGPILRILILTRSQNIENYLLICDNLIKIHDSRMLEELFWVQLGGNCPPGPRNRYIFEFFRISNLSAISSMSSGEKRVHSIRDRAVIGAWMNEFWEKNLWLNFLFYRLY